MKFIFSTLLFLVFFSVFGQNNQYYPSVSKIFNTEDDKKLSKDFGYFNDWIDQNTKGVFYKNLQTSVSSKGDSFFLSLALIFLKQNSFALGNSGISLVFNKGKSDFSSPISVQIEQKYKILAYLREFDPNDYDPKDLKQRFDLGVTILNLSEETVLEAFLEQLVKDKKNEKNSAIQQLKQDLKTKAKINIVTDEKNEKDLIESIVSQMQEQTDKPVSEVLYDLYISSKDKVKEEIYFRLFFSDFIHEDASEFIDKVIAYNLYMSILGHEMSIVFPKDVLKITDSKQPDQGVEIKPDRIEMTSIRTKEKKYIEFAVILKETTNPTEFNALNEIKLNRNPLISSDSKRTLTAFKTSDIEKIVFSVYENEITVNMIVKNRSMYTRSFMIMKQPFRLNSL
jgi:hypothetical protein